MLENPNSRGTEQVFVSSLMEVNYKQSDVPSMRQVRKIKSAIASAQQLVQSPPPSNTPSAEVVQITGVKANPTNIGVEVILETSVGTKLQVTNRSTGNNFIVDVSGGQLRLPDGNAFTFRSEKPLAGITEIAVTNINANTVRVTVVGEKALPRVELFDDNAGLVFGIVSTATATSLQQPPQTPQAQQQPASETQPEQPSAQDDEPIELVVTGEQDTYRVTDGSTATKTDTPLRDIPQSIQVVPRQVLQDQQVTTNLTEALRNVPGVVQGGNSSSRGQYQLPTIRGFNSSNSILRDGLLDLSLSNIGFDAVGFERIEVLKEPASVLYGQGTLGGTINLVTKKPLRDPYYSAEFSAGSYNFYRGAIDLSGPLNDSKTVLYRLNAAAQTTESFVDFFDGQQYFVAPSLTWLLSDRTKLNLQAEYINRPKDFGQQGIPAVGSVLPNPNGKIPRSRNTSEPFSTDNSRTFRIGYDLEHRFSENWQLRYTFSASWNRQDREYVFGYRLEDNNRFVERLYLKGAIDNRVFNVDTYVIGKFATGSIGHQLVTGFNYTRYENDSTDNRRQATPLDLFNPVYGTPLGASFGPESSGNFGTNAYGFYVQDQITLLENLKLLLGGRFDIENEKLDFTSGNSIASSSAQYEVFSPRLGIVYQPIPAISLYANYSRSFLQVVGTAFDNRLFEPERGTSYEVGLKADVTNKISATLAFYDLTRSNVLTTNPANSNFSIQTGEQRSKGVEFDIGGEILPGWNVIASYAYTDAEITQDNRFAVGNQLNNIPKNAFSIWTTYEIQRGKYKGFGAGLGFFFVGDRQGNLANSFELPSYFRTDASIFYNRDQLRIGLNIRNLFDIRYFDTALSNLSVFPGEPVTVYGSISYEF